MDEGANTQGCAAVDEQQPKGSCCRAPQTEARVACYLILKLNITRCGAVGSALALGARRRRFESCHLDHESIPFVGCSFFAHKASARARELWATHPNASCGGLREDLLPQRSTENDLKGVFCRVPQGGAEGEDAAGSSPVTRTSGAFRLWGALFLLTKQVRVGLNFKPTFNSQFSS